MDKQEVYRDCLSIVLEKIESLKDEIASIQEDANKETKSSAGDKYETGRAMSQIQKDNASRQLSEVLKLKKVLDTLDLNRRDSISLGSLVKTNVLTFFISVGLSEKLIGDVYALSPISPLSKAFIGKEKGEEVLFRGKKYIVLDVK